MSQVVSGSKVGFADLRQSFGARFWDVVSVLFAFWIIDLICLLLVLAIGAGCAMDMTDRFFINIGAGYQIGFQSQDEGIHQMELRTRYVRLAMGGGVKF